MPKKSTEHELAKEYVAAVAANDHKKAERVFKEIEAHNSHAPSKDRITVSKRKVNAAVVTAGKHGQVDTSFIRQLVDKPGIHKKILKGGCWGMTRRGRRGTRSTRKNGFKLF